jgi:hypothetical protein
MIAIAAGAGNATGRTAVRSSILGHPGGSSIREEAVDRAARVEIAENAIPTRLGRRTERAAHNGPQALAVCANGKDT